MFYHVLFPILWLAFIAVWVAMARGGKAVAQRESVYSRLSHYLPLIIAIYLISAPHVPIAILNDRFAPLALWVVRLGAALTAAGIAFAIWARLWIADNWSSDVTLKRGHELIVDGPYAWVRHPIYTGILLALIGTGLAVGEWRAVLAVVLAALAFWRKLTIEEGVMRRQFGDAYTRYAARTPALVPFVVRAPKPPSPALTASPCPRLRR
jgi:protein-S-isoprenylcysteine O-methyltransferase Ste14